MDWHIRREGVDFSESLSVDEEGNAVYITGGFTFHIDFDPGPFVDLKQSKGGLDCYLTKLSTNGNYQWTRTWGGPKHDACHTVGVTPQGMVAAAGSSETRSIRYGSRYPDA